MKVDCKHYITAHRVVFHDDGADSVIWIAQCEKFDSPVVGEDCGKGKCACYTKTKPNKETEK